MGCEGGGLLRRAFRRRRPIGAGGWEFGVCGSARCVRSPPHREGAGGPSGCSEALLALPSRPRARRATGRRPLGLFLSHRVGALCHLLDMGWRSPAVSEQAWLCPVGGRERAVGAAVLRRAERNGEPVPELSPCERGGGGFQLGAPCPLGWSRRAGQGWAGVRKQSCHTP